MNGRPLGSRDFTDGTRRPVYADRDGRQYVRGNDGERVYGTWLAEGDAADEPVIVEPRERRLPCPPSR
jgi:hypothetical protein